MSTHHRILPIIAVTGTSLMVGCGGRGGSCGSYGSYGSYGSAGSCAGGQNLGPAGVYEGSIIDAAAQQGAPVVAIIAENGDGRMMSQDGTYYRLNVGAIGSNLTGTFIGLSQGGTLPNNSHSSSGSVSGGILPQNLDMYLTDLTNTQRTAILNYDPAYALGSSLMTLAGNWTFSANGFNLAATVQADGTFAATDSNNCTYTGSFGLINPNFNAYSETHVRLCSGVSAVFSGLATFVPASGSGPNAVPTIIRLLTDDASGEYLVAEFQ